MFQGDRHTRQPTVLVIWINRIKQLRRQNLNSNWDIYHIIFNGSHTNMAENLIKSKYNNIESINYCSPFELTWSVLLLLQCFIFNHGGWVLQIMNLKYEEEKKLLTWSIDGLCFSSFKKRRKYLIISPTCSMAISNSAECYSYVNYRLGHCRVYTSVMKVLLARCRV